MTTQEYRQRLMMAYLPAQSKSGLEWHNWVCDAVRDAKMTITEAHDLLSYIYQDDPDLPLYCAVASLRLYERLDKPTMIARLRDRVGSVIDRFML